VCRRLVLSATVTAAFPSRASFRRFLSVRTGRRLRDAGSDPRPPTSDPPPMRAFPPTFSPAATHFSSRDSCAASEAPEPHRPRRLFCGFGTVIISQRLGGSLRFSISCILTREEVDEKSIGISVSIIGKSSSNGRRRRRRRRRHRHRRRVYVRTSRLRG
jgi:hypothetical protein